MSSALVRIVINGKESQPMPHYTALAMLDGMDKRTRNKATIEPYAPTTESAARAATPPASQYDGWTSGPSAQQAASMAAQVRARYQPSRLDPTLRGLAG